MPRKSRIDAPGAVHHIIARGVDRNEIFRDNADRNDFVDRLGRVLGETHTACYAWALVPNHFHLLLKTGGAPISTVMRRLLTGYAISHNRRHRRSGHLFQNRYKSILCQEDAYLLELVRYIHLNPLRAGIVQSLAYLDRYSYAGHSAVMGMVKKEWQDVRYVLRMFSAHAGHARRKYRAFVAKGVSEGKRPDLTGGGLVRSIGGWSALKAARRAGLRQKGDERILGDGDFVEAVLDAANEAMERKYRVIARGFDLEKVAERVAEVLGMDYDEVWAPGKYRRTVAARSLLCFWAVRDLGIPMATLARRLSISVPAISKSVVRGEMLVHQQGYNLCRKPEV